MKVLIISMLLLLSGCSTVVPVTQKFPQAPEILLQQCPPLKELQQDASLIDLTKVVVENYTKYYECSVLLEGWHDWYRKQREIYKELK